MAEYIAVFENPDTFDGVNYFPFSAKTKKDALKLLFETIDQTPVRLYREVSIDG